MPRENTEKLLEMVQDGMFDESMLIRDLLNFLDDREVGEFMSQYGYEDPDFEDEEPEYPQDEIDEEEAYEASKYDDFEDSEDT